MYWKIQTYWLYRTNYEDLITGTKLAMIKKEDMKNV
jgi:hypothetical protein